jgi:outer membrane protein
MTGAEDPVFPIFASIAHAEPLTLAEALSEAFGANPELRVASLGLARSEAELLAAQGAWDPRLTGSVFADASTSPTNDRIDGTARLVSGARTVSAGLHQSVPTGGELGLDWSESSASSNSRNAIAADTVSDRLTLSVTQPVLSGIGPDLGVARARLGLDRETLALRQAREELVVDVSTAYWTLVAARTSLDLAARSREVAEGSAAETQVRYDQGFAGSGEVLQVQRALGEARQSEVVAAAGVESAEAALRRLLGRAVVGGASIEPADRPTVPEDLPTVDEVLPLARDNAADWLMQELDARSAALDVRSARRAALPALDLTGAIGSTGLGESSEVSRRALATGEFVDWSVGTTLAVALPARTLRAELTEARLDEQVARTTLDAAEQDLALAVQSAVRAVALDRSRVALSDETVRVAGLALASDQELFREGRCPARQVVDSLEALGRAQADQLSAQIDLQRSLLEVRRLAGTLLE